MVLSFSLLEPGFGRKFAELVQARSQQKDGPVLSKSPSPHQRHIKYLRATDVKSAALSFWELSLIRVAEAQARGLPLDAVDAVVREFLIAGQPAHMGGQRCLNRS